MNIIVLAKHAPDPESEINVASDGKSVDTRGLVYDINDWDRYAVEEAIRIKVEECIYSSGVKNIGMQLCIFIAGILEGSLTRASRVEWHVSETKCIASGSSYCESNAKLKIQVS